MVGKGERIGVLVQAHGQTHVGLVRRENQDRFAILRLAPHMVLLAIADGMGGEAGGGVAADMLMESVTSEAAGVSLTPGGLADLLIRAGERIRARAEKESGLRHMGTTGVLVGISGECVAWAHVGDSRLYLLRSGRLTQVTRDHSFLQDLLESGEIRLQEVRLHPFRHMLDQCVGCPTCLPQSGSFKPHAGDRLLLCTDGVHDELDDALLAETMAEGAPEKATRRLIASALEHGGRDNATVVVAKVEETQDEPTPPLFEL